MNVSPVLELCLQEYVCICLGMIESRNTHFNRPSIMCMDDGSKVNMCLFGIYKRILHIPDDQNTKVWRH